MSVSVKTPGSSANLGPGFDVLGLAVTLHNTIGLESAGSGLELTVTGEGQGKIDRRPHDNLAVRTIKRFYQRIDTAIPPLRVVMDNRIPLSRGLGSSAATIVGALTAANALSGAGLSKERLFDLAVEIEGHPDNVAAAVYGGLTIAYRQGQSFQVCRCDLAERIGFAALIPEAGLSTAKARAALPDTVARSAAVFNIGRTALLIESLLTGDLSVVSAALEDALHQPWRRTLIGDYDAVVDACAAAGALGTALSGAGPTMIAFYDREQEAVFRTSLEAGAAAGGLRRRVAFLSVDPRGATIA